MVPQKQHSTISLPSAFRLSSRSCLSRTAYTALLSRSFTGTFVSKKSKMGSSKMCSRNPRLSGYIQSAAVDCSRVEKGGYDPLWRSPVRTLTLVDAKHRQTLNHVTGNNRIGASHIMAMCRFRAGTPSPEALLREITMAKRLSEEKEGGRQIELCEFHSLSIFRITYAFLCSWHYSRES
ncbi:hypothetical protein BDW71DRAFT_190915 [Aspergillus fruticulosus]